MSRLSLGLPVETRMRSNLMVFNHFWVLDFESCTHADDDDDEDVVCVAKKRKTCQRVIIEFTSNFI